MKRRARGGLYPIMTDGFHRGFPTNNLLGPGGLVAPQTQPIFRPDSASKGNEDDDQLDGIGGGPIDAIIDAFSHYTDKLFGDDKAKRDLDLDMPQFEPMDGRAGLEMF